MLGNSSENSFWLKKKMPVKKFDEGRHLDTGEIDPLTGERVVIDLNTLDKKTEEKPKYFIKKDKFENKVCQYCESDPCATDCDYR